MGKITKVGAGLLIAIGAWGFVKLERHLWLFCFRAVGEELNSKSIAVALGQVRLRLLNKVLPAIAKPLTITLASVGAVGGVVHFFARKLGYATLVVRLHHTVAFQSTELWKSAADFKTQTGAALGFTLTRETEGTSCLEVYFEPDVDANSRVLFLRYVHDHLTQHLRHYACGNKKCDAFDQPFADQGLRRDAGHPHVGWRNPLDGDQRTAPPRKQRRDVAL